MLSQLQNNTIDRWIGRINGAPELPAALFIGGIHGNELSGIKAIRRVFQTIEIEQIEVNGSIYGIRGNLKAIQDQERYIDVDLNRAWTNKNLRKIEQNKLHFAEDTEVVEIKAILDGLLTNRQSPIAMVDLHTTSSESPPFAIFDDSLRNRALANRLPVPKVLGIIEKLQGTILGYYGDKGPITMVFEAGQHDAKPSIDFHESAIWISLVHMNIIQESAIDYAMHVNRLRKASKHSPTLVETTLRYALDYEDEFEMQPGFRNFSKVKKGDFLAKHNGLDVFAERDSYIFMPLYQKKGEDGFFIVRPISPFWIRISEWMRRRKLDNYVTFFPGVKKDKKRPNTYIVNTKTARFRALDFLHLLGFRKQRLIGNQLYVSRIPYDIQGPWDTV